MRLWLVLKLMVAAYCISIINGQACRSPISYCEKYQLDCLKGTPGFSCFTTGKCGQKCGTYCELYNGRYCKGAPKLKESDGSREKCIPLDKWRSIALSRTNVLRWRHGAAPLEKDSKLTRIAQWYAEHLVQTGKWEHSYNGYGENLAKAQGSMQNQPWPNYAIKAYSPEYAINDWYNEISSWDFALSTGRPGAQIGHFTQLIWNSSRKVGHGFATSQDCSMIITVANYYPEGNNGMYKQNVAPRVNPHIRYCEADPLWCRKIDTTAAGSSANLPSICVPKWQTDNCDKSCGAPADLYRTYCTAATGFSSCSRLQSSMMLHGVILFVLLILLLVRR